VSAVEAPAWARYADETLVDDFAWWCRTYLVQSIDAFDGAALDLEDFQCDFMAEALSRDALGRWIWRSVALILPRKNGKTVLLAAYALYRLMTDDGMPEILLAASSDKQAGRLFDAIVAFVRRSPELSDALIVREYIGEIARADGRGRILRMASDPKRLHGYNPSLVICDELAQWNEPKLRKAWAALTTGGGARTAAQTFVITTAGEAQERADGILGRLVDANEKAGEVERRDALTISRNEKARTLVFNYSAPTTDPQDVAAVKKANPASWITEEFLERQAANPELTPEEFLQLHACVWSDAAEAWVKRASWDALRVAGLEPEPGADVWVGIDAALTEDCTAVSWAWRVDDDRVGVGCYVWAARRGNAAHELVPGGSMDTRCVIPFVDSLAERYRVREVVYDKNRLEVVALMLSERGYVVADAWTQGANRAKAWTAFYGAVQTATIAHDGDAVLAEHVGGAQARMSEHGWKVEKLRQRRAQKIDALVASAMAHWRCQVASDVSPFLLVA
jgi:phage terminase large subunit-like protein